MKTAFLLAHRSKIAAGGLLVGCCLLMGSSASAQNRIRNGDFETPQAATNGIPYWSVAYPWGGPDDFEIVDRATYVRGAGGYWSACLRPAHDKWAHVYLSQTASNLLANHSYAVSGYMEQERWKGVSDPNRDEYLVYIEAIGGQGTPTPDGRARVLAVASNQSNLDAPYTYPNTSWLQFTNKQTPAANGTIEIRLHLSKVGWVLADKLSTMAGYFDDITLTY
jgi:hypothetical protein